MNDHPWIVQISSTNVLVRYNAKGILFEIINYDHVGVGDLKCKTHIIRVE